jgi:glycosyltransferase involved in cell wall biosynthesis
MTLLKMERIPMIKKRDITWPKITIIIAVKNAELYLQRTFDSITQQKYPNIQLIVMDGASSDNTINIIQKNENIIDYWQTESDESHGDACNKARPFVKGDLITYANGDDWYENDIFFDVANAYLNNKEIDLITCAGRIVTGEYPENIQTKFLYIKEKTLSLTLKNICEGVSAICCRFFAKSFWDKVGYYKEVIGENKRHYTTDKDLLIRAYFEKPKCVFIKKIGYVYYAHTGSTTFSPDRRATPVIYKEHLYWAQYYLTQNTLTIRERGYFKLWYAKTLLKQQLFYVLKKNWIFFFSKENKNNLFYCPGTFFICVLFSWIWLPYSKLYNKLVINR